MSLRIIVLISCFAIAAACSSRVVYNLPPSPTVSADALNINTASVDELEKLPHIGRKTAEAIVQFRDQNGPFRKPEYLLQIRGISETRFAELRPYLKTE